MDELFSATIYGRAITGRTITEIKRKASIVANRNFRPCDTMIVTWDGCSSPLHYCRINQVAPNNTIKRGKWI